MKGIMIFFKDNFKRKLKKIGKFYRLPEK